MRKTITKKVSLAPYKRPCKIECDIEDSNGYISITGTIYCFNGGIIASGCIHEEIAKKFPSVRPFLDLHLVDVKGAIPMHFYSNGLHHLVNGNLELAQRTLFCTDEELRELKALADYGLHKTLHKGYHCQTINAHTDDWYSCDNDAERVFAAAVDRLGIRERIRKHIDDFYAFVETL